MLFLLSVLVTAVQAVCNCVQCNNPNHIIGSQTWCRCCRNTIGEECASSCPDSVFTSGGCLALEYDTNCRGTTVTATTLLPPSPPLSTSSSTPPPTNAPEIPLLVLRQCNCAGCSYLGVPVASWTWCRCCDQTFKSTCNDTTLTLDEACKKSVFTSDGCTAQNYSEVCFE